MRKQGWERILESYILGHADTEFVWGQNDCVLFSVNGAQAILDRDLGPERSLYGEYDESRAGEIIEEKGSMSSIMDPHFPRRQYVTQAQRGDIVLVRGDGLKAFGLVDNTGRRVACKTLSGMIYVPLTKGLRAWEVQ